MLAAKKGHVASAENLVTQDTSGGHLEDVEAVNLSARPPLLPTACSPGEAVTGEVEPGEDSGLALLDDEPLQAREGHRSSTAAIHHGGDSSLEAAEVGLHSQHSGVMVHVDVKVYQTRHHQQVPAVAPGAGGQLRVSEGHIF